MHPHEKDLALYTGGELSFWARWRVKSHLLNCEDCRSRLEGYTVSRAYLCETATQLPEGLEWNRIAAEMSANIHLGLSAGECVSLPQRAAPAHLTGWKPAMVFASALMVVLLAYMVNVKKPAIPTNMVMTPPHQGVMLQATAAGIDLNDNGRVLTLKHPKDRDVTFTVTLESVRARYVDSESGQVTINNVYVE